MHSPPLLLGLGWKWAPIGGLQYRTLMQAPKYDVQFLRYSEILVENREIVIPSLYLAPPQGLTPSEFREDV